MLSELHNAKEPKEPEDSPLKDTRHPQSVLFLHQPPKRWIVIVGIVVATLILLGGAVAYFLLHTNKQAGTSKNDRAISSQPAIGQTEDGTAVTVGKSLSNGYCSGTGSTKLGALPMKESDFAYILPYGLMVGGHVTPVDHQYFSPTVFHSAKDTYPVYAMADAKIVGIEVHPTRIRLVFSVSCTFFYYYDLLTSVEPNINDKALPINVKAGQLIGHIGGQTLDFAVWDTTKPLKGFIVPDHYKAEPWKIYTADPLDYYTSAVKANVLNKYLRTSELRSGKIDYDIDGKLAGNWFQTDTNGYSGTSGEGGGSYWEGHLSFAPEYLDPATQVISVGYLAPTDGAGSNQFVVPKSEPKPDTVSPKTGLVKYDLAKGWSYKTAGGGFWDRTTFADGGLSVDHSSDGSAGCALVQMVGDRTLKFEAFLGRSCSSVQDFKSPRTYER